MGSGQESTAGQRIRAARKALNWSMEDLARELGVTKTTVANWETGKHGVHGNNLLRLAKVLRRPPEEFADESAGRPARIAHEGTYPSLGEFLRSSVARDIKPEHEAELRTIRDLSGDPGLEFYVHLYAALQARDRHQARAASDDLTPPRSEPRAPSRTKPEGEVLHAGSAEYEVALRELMSWGHRVKGRVAIARIRDGYLVGRKPVKRPK